MAWKPAGTCAPPPGVGSKPSPYGLHTRRLALQNKFTDPPAEASRRDTQLREARQALGEARARAAEDRGAAMSLTAAVQYAQLLSAPVPQPAEPSELARLSARERELVPGPAIDGPTGVRDDRA
jgi:hypothetical protein